MTGKVNFDRLASIIEGFDSYRVAVVGDVALDEALYGTIERLNPENRACPLVKKTTSKYTLGCAANVASNISSFNAWTYLYGVIGNDNYGSEVRKLCKSGISPDLFLEGPTMCKQRIFGDGHYLTRVDYGETELSPLSSAISLKILNGLENLDSSRGGVGSIVLSDYYKRVFRGDLAQRVIQLARRMNVPVFAAPKPENVGKFSGVDLLCVNLSEAGKATGIMGYERRRESALKLKEMTGSKYVIVTCGEHGMCSYDGDFHESPTKAKQVIDVSGAGDTVLSALTLSLLSGANIAEASQIANYAAGIVVEKPGTAVVGIPELIERIRADSR